MRLVVGGHCYLDDLAAGFALENPVTDLRRLDDPIARLKPKRLALVFVHHLYSAFDTADHLELDLVVMNVVGNLAVEGKTNARNRKLAIEIVTSQIAIQHAGAAHGPIGLGCSGFHG